MGHLAGMFANRPPGRRPAVSPRRVAGWLLGGVLLAFAAAAPAQSTRPGWGAIPYHDALGTGVTFRVWAPYATNLHVPGQFNSWSTTATPLAKELTNGVWNQNWSVDVPGALPGQQYKYYVSSTNGNAWKHDPRARMVGSSSSGSNDIIYDPTAFNWAGDSFTPPALSNLVIYEIHIGDFYAPNAARLIPGKFTDATNRLDYLKNLGINAVEVMPISEFPGQSSWGYNPADLFAADNYAYGGPDGFKAFVKACHAHGLAVLLDVVHNHYGPTDLDIWDFDGWTGGGSGSGIYFYQNSPECCTSYGPRPNFSRQQVRDFVQDNFRMWLDECHVDGFRWDTPGLMMNTGSSFLSDAASLINTITGMIRSNYPGKIDIAEDVTGYGFDSTWDTTFHNYLTPQLAYTNDASRDLTAVTYALTNNTVFNFAAGLNRVVFLESHDVVGDLNNGARLVVSIDSNTPASYRARKLSTLGAALTFTAPGVPLLFEGQEMLESLQFSSSRAVIWNKTNTYSGIVQLYHDLIRLRQNLDSNAPGLLGDQCRFLQVDTVNKLLAYRRWSLNTANSDVVVVANFAGAARSNYSLTFPAAGNWYTQLNSDATAYGADYGNAGSPAVYAAGSTPVGRVTIAPYSVLILSQTPVPPPLTTTATGGGVIIAWPAGYAGWVLDTAPALAGSPAWTPVPAAQYQSNSTSIFFTNTVSNNNNFYRLRLPN
jgi:1,4-alpha-glucan branching enzyme